MRLPVYLIHYDAPNWVRRATDSVLASDLPVTVTVINNGPQESLDVDGRITVLSTNGNKGYAGGANAALRHWLGNTDHPFCVIGSHDLHVAPNALRVLVEAGDRSPSFGMLAPALPSDSELEVPVTDRIEHRSVCGTALLLRRDCVLDVGGFDEDFGSYCEDEEMCVRILRAGWNVGRVPDAEAWGLGSASPRRNRIAYGNMLLLAHKTLRPQNVVLGVGSHVKRALLAFLRGDWHEMRDRFLGLMRGLRSLLKLAAGRGVGAPSFQEYVKARHSPRQAISTQFSKIE